MRRSIPQEPVSASSDNDNASTRSALVLTGLLCLALCAASGCKENDARSDHDNSPSPSAPAPTGPSDGAHKDKPSRNVIVDENKPPASLTPAPVSSREVPDALIREMTSAVALEAGVDTDDVVLVRAEPVTWRDGSLGCPQPNMAYTQALVDGYWVVFRVGREEFDMRATKIGAFSRCTGATKQAPIRHGDQ